MLFALRLRFARRGLKIGPPLAGGRPVPDTAAGQLNFNRVSYYSFDHGLIPVVPAPAPPRFGLLIAVPYHGTAATTFAAEEFYIDDVARPFELAHPGKPLRHGLEKGIDVGIRVQPCPRQEQIASQSARDFDELLSGLIIEVRLQHAFDYLCPEQSHEELPLTSFFFGHSVRQFLSHYLCSLML